MSSAFDCVVVGAGFAGSVIAERLATRLCKKVLVIDKRDHIGGNAYDYYDETGILVHKYGPHIFHTNDANVVAYLSQFTEWRNYEHRVLACVDGKLVPFPINVNTINQLFGLSLDGQAMQAFLHERIIPCPNIRTSEDIIISRVGRDLYNKFYRGYTIKQWGLDPGHLDASVAGRIPVRFDYEDRYFTDCFQAIPKYGYRRLFETMLAHPLIEVRTGIEYRKICKEIHPKWTIYTGPIDEFFDYRYGRLPYRSLIFRHETVSQEFYQAAAVVNYPNEEDYTRITEFKYITGQASPSTSILFEYPSSIGDPYYPIPCSENAAIYARYKDLALRTSGVIFIGRLGSYRYYNMDQVVAQALMIANKFPYYESVTKA